MFILTKTRQHVTRAITVEYLFPNIHGTVNVSKIEVLLLWLKMYTFLLFEAAQAVLIRGVFYREATLPLRKQAVRLAAILLQMAIAVKR